MKIKRCTGKEGLQNIVKYFEHKIFCKVECAKNSTKIGIEKFKNYRNHFE